ncbi:phage tail protein [Chromobacterium vaccinii]|uniref:phage tail protein n=1 Tax=Chromobacterium vaccinii TaxID=1108595 RepID=UPI003260938A
MVDIVNPKVPGFPNVYQIEKTDKVQGGAGGVANRQAEQLVERTAFLKKQIDDIVSGALVAEYADRLKAPRVIAMTGDGAWSVTFDGNGNVTAAMVLANTGIAAGSYGIVTVDAKGRVTAGRQMGAGDVPAHDWSKISTGKPTTLDGYGITDAQPASPDLTALANLKGAPGFYVNTGPGAATVRSLAAGQGVTISNGDGKAGNPAVALANSGVAAGSYGIVTVDAMGRVTAGRQMGAGDVPAHDWSKITSGKPTTLAGYGIVDAVRPSDLAAAGFMDTAMRLTTGACADFRRNGIYYVEAPVSGRPASAGGIMVVNWLDQFWGTLTYYAWGGVTYEMRVEAGTAGAWQVVAKQATVAPPGQVAFFAGSAVPDGWLRANGAAVSRDAYAALFASIGTTYGAGDGKTTFTLPDLRGEFVRGWDDSGKVDSNRRLGSWQKGSLAAFDPTKSNPAVSSICSDVDDRPAIYDSAGYDVPELSKYPRLTVTATTAAREGDPLDGLSGVVRPRNIALQACIKH